MEIFYKDVFNSEDNWSYLEIQVKGDIKPKLRLSAGNKCFKLSSSGRVHFWGNIEQGYYGVWLLYNPEETELSDMPIAPIPADVVRSAPENAYARLSYWSKYFAQSIAKSENSLFYKGKWKITPALSTSSLVRTRLYSKKEVSEIQQGFYQTNPLYLDWGMNGNFTLVAIKPELEEDASRVKRWRKEVRNGTCPPVLAWYVSCLCAYVILDGHCRLKAFHCEGVDPDILVLESIIEYERKPDPEIGAAIMKNIEKRQNHKWKSPKTVEEINNLLVSVFDDRPFESSVSKSLAKKDFDQEWLEEVSKFKKTKGIDQEILEDMIEG